MTLANRTVKYAALGGIVCSLVSLSTFAAQPSNGWYVSGQGGISSVPNNTDYTTSKTTLGITTTHTFTNPNYHLGYNLGGAVGYKKGPIRYAAEVNYFNAKVRSYDYNSTPQTDVNGYTYATTLIGTAYYDFDKQVSASVVPFVGAGVGFAHVGTKLSNDGTNTNTELKLSDNALAYKATAGVNYNFASKMALKVAYEHLETFSKTNLGERFKANSAVVGLVYRFDQPNHVKSRTS